MAIYSDLERRIALIELRTCLAIANHIRAEWREPGGCADEIARTLQERYDRLQAVAAASTSTLSC